MRLKFPKIKYIFLGVIIISFSFAAGWGVGHQGLIVEITKGPKVTISRIVPEPNLDFSLFWKVWDNLNASYYDKSKLSPSKMVYGAIHGMVSSIGDPYTMFLPPNENQITNEDLQGNFSGVGIEIGYKGQTLAVEAPLPGSPAEKAGIKPGDLIARIQDKNKNLDTTTENITLAQAVEDIRGPQGSEVILTLIRGSNQPMVISLVRQVINVPSVMIDYQGTNSDIAHISILKFGGDTLSEWNKVVESVQQKSNIKGVILDLRNNPGGYLQDAVDIAGDFLPQNSVVVIQQNGDGTKQELKTNKADGNFINSKVVVLVNGGSASASEILSGALRDDRKIQLIGDKTFGKGTIQVPEDLDGGAGIHITIAKWLTPNGTWVHGNGLTPDIKVSNDQNGTTDVQLNQAVKTISVQ